MPESYLSDTVACSRWRRGDAALRRKVEALPSDAALFTSVVSVGEPTLGIYRAPQEHKEKLRQRTHEMLLRFKAILDVTHRVAEKYGEMVSQVPPGQHIGQNDYWIAAIALIHDLVLITNDPDFDRVSGLRTEKWLR